MEIISLAISAIISTITTLATNNIVGFKLFQTPNSEVKHLAKKQPVWEQLSLANPNGYKSCVEFIDNKLLITCGTSGVDLSKDKGASWEKISDVSFHIVKKHPTKIWMIIKNKITQVVK